MTRINSGQAHREQAKRNAVMATPNLAMLTPSEGSRCCVTRGPAGAGAADGACSWRHTPLPATRCPRPARARPVTLTLSVALTALMTGAAAWGAHAEGTKQSAEGLAVEHVADWLDERLATIHATALPDSERLTPETIQEVRARLDSEGLDARVAGALAPQPTEGTSLKRQVYLLEGTGRRLRAFARATARPITPAPQQARTDLEQILRDPTFNLETRRTGSLERAMAAFRRMIFGLIVSAMEAASSHARLLTVVIGTVIVAALFLVFGKIVTILRRGPRAPALVPRHPSTMIPDGEDPRATFARALAFAASGRGREAVTLLEAASVEALRRQGELPEDPGLTDLEAVRWLRGHGRHDVRAPFEKLSSIHDRVVYGGSPAQASVVQDAVGLARALVLAPSEPAP